MLDGCWHNSDPLYSMYPVTELHPLHPYTPIELHGIPLLDTIGSDLREETDIHRVSEGIIV